jgi:Protein of unknown function (DUF2490)
MKLYILILLLLFCKTNTIAQNKEVTKQSFYWTRYYNQLKINEKLNWHNEFDNRTFFKNNKHNQFIINSILHNKLSKKIDVAFGLTYSLQEQQIPNVKSTLTVLEIRPLQEITFSSFLTKKITLQQRFRIEERFIHQNNGTELLDGYNFNFRFRYIIVRDKKIKGGFSTLLYYT